MEKQWIWGNSSGGVHAAIADFDDESIQWLEEPGCACSTYNNFQKFSHFLANGRRFLLPPADILAEMQAALQAVPSD